jgi:hypothetical protein
MRRPSNLGQGAALRTGFAQAQLLGPISRRGLSWTEAPVVID